MTQEDRFRHAVQDHETDPAVAPCNGLLRLLGIFAVMAIVCLVLL